MEPAAREPYLRVSGSRPRGVEKVGARLANDRVAVLAVVLKRRAA